MNVIKEFAVLGVILAVIIVLVIFLIKSRPKDDRFHRNVTPGQNKLIRLVLVVAIVMAAVFFIKRLKDSGVGALFTDASSVTEAVQKIAEEGNTVYIVIGTKSISVGGREYADVRVAEPALIKAAQSGKRIVISEDYAQEKSVKAVLKILNENGIKVTSEDVISEGLTESE